MRCTLRKQRRPADGPVNDRPTEDEVLWIEPAHEAQREQAGFGLRLGDGYAPALTNFKFIANAVVSTGEAASAFRTAKAE